VIPETPENRALVDRASVGVAFTPVDIRIGLDFGSQAHKCRSRYYEMLMNGELLNELESLNRKDRGTASATLFGNYQIRKCSVTSMGSYSV